MSERLMMELFVTRWLVLAALGLVLGLVINGITYTLKKDGPAYSGSGFWWLYGLALATLHIGGFMYHKTLPRWEMCVGAGLMIAYCATSFVRVFSGWLYVKMVRVYAVTLAIAFPLVIWLGAERWLIDVLEKVRSM